MSLFIFLVCWEPDAHDRPSFERILLLLDDIARSPFAQTPHESFHTMQEDWKMEIEVMFDDIRVKEKVRFKYSVFNFKIMS